MGKLNWHISDASEEVFREFVEDKHGSAYKLGDEAETALLNHVRGQNSDSDEPSNQELYDEINELKQIIAEGGGPSRAAKKKNRGEAESPPNSQSDSTPVEDDPRGWTGPFAGYDPASSRDSFTREEIVQAKQQPDTLEINPYHLPEFGSEFSSDIDWDSRDSEKPLQKDALIPVARAAMRYTKDEVGREDAMFWIEQLTTNSDTMQEYWTDILSGFPENPLTGGRVTSEEVLQNLLSDEFESKISNLRDAVDAVADASTPSQREEKCDDVKELYSSIASFADDYGFDLDRAVSILDDLDDAKAQSRVKEKKAAQSRVESRIGTLEELPSQVAEEDEWSAVEEYELEALEKRKEIEETAEKYESVQVERDVDALVEMVKEACDEARDRIEARIEAEREERREELREVVSEVEEVVIEAEELLESGDDDKAYKTAVEALEEIGDDRDEMDDLGDVGHESVISRAEKVKQVVEERAKERQREVARERREEREEEIRARMERFVERVEEEGDDVGSNAWFSLLKGLNGWFASASHVDMKFAKGVMDSELEDTGFELVNTGTRWVVKPVQNAE